jgi:hypothetical protein
MILQERPAASSLAILARKLPRVLLGKAPVFSTYPNSRRVNAPAVAHEIYRVSGKQRQMSSLKSTVSKPAAVAFSCAIIGSVALWVGVFAVANAAM